MNNSLSAFLKLKWLQFSTYSGSCRLSMSSLILLISLDIFVLGLLFKGMQEAAQTIHYPRLAISSRCLDMTVSFLKRNPAEKADSLKSYVKPKIFKDPYDDNELDSYGFAKNEKLPVCNTVKGMLYSYANDKSLSSLFLEL